MLTARIIDGLSRINVYVSREVYLNYCEVTGAETAPDDNGAGYICLIISELREQMDEVRVFLTYYIAFADSYVEHSSRASAVRYDFKGLLEWHMRDVGIES